jgi:hypothetical protein
MKNQPASSILRPYTFILREGKGINSDLLDYKLLLLNLHCSEVLKSPSTAIPAKDEESRFKNNAESLIEQMEALVRQLENSTPQEELSLLDFPHPATDR